MCICVYVSDSGHCFLQKLTFPFRIWYLSYGLWYIHRGNVISIFHCFLKYTEQWLTAPICTYTSKYSEPVVDFKDPGLALRTPSSGPADVVRLGRTRKGKFIPRPNLNREFRAKSLKVSDSYCIFKLPDIFGKSVAGRFYTNVYGNKLLNAPGVANVAQYIKPGFHAVITGNFEVSEPWLGLYKDGVHGSFQNIAGAIDPLVN